MILKSNQVTIKTPEGVTFNIKLASIPRRMFAFMIDLLLISAVMGAMSKFINSFFSLIFSDIVAAAINVLISFCVIQLYWIITEYKWGGRTVGKKLFNIKVIDSEALPLTFAQVLLRNLLRVIDLMPLGYATGLITAFFTKKTTRLGDIAASTLVVENKLNAQPELQYFSPSKYNFLRENPLLMAKIRDQITKEEQQLLLNLQGRKNKLLTEEKIKVFQLAKDYFCKRFNLPIEATSGLSDEKILTNIIDIIYNK